MLAFSTPVPKPQAVTVAAVLRLLGSLSSWLSQEGRVAALERAVHAATGDVALEVTVVSVSDVRSERRLRALLASHVLFDAEIAAELPDAASAHAFMRLLQAEASLRQALQDEGFTLAALVRVAIVDAEPPPTPPTMPGPATAPPP
eukprot:3678430-Rhodomonas_salina.1